MLHHISVLLNVAAFFFMIVFTVSRIRRIRYENQVVYAINVNDTFYRLKTKKIKFKKNIGEKVLVFAIGQHAFISNVQEMALIYAMCAFCFINFSNVLRYVVMFLVGHM